MRLRVFENTYKSFESYLDEIRNTIKKYARTDLKIGQTGRQFQRPGRHKVDAAQPKRREILNIVRKQGFELMIRSRQRLTAVGKALPDRRYFHSNRITCMVRVYISLSVWLYIEDT